MVNRNGGMEQSILAKAEYIIGIWSFSFGIQRNSPFYITFYCFPVFVFVSIALRHPITPKPLF